MNIAILSDTFSGVTKHDITGINIFVLQIPLLLNGEIKEDFDTISFSKFDKMIYNNYKIECGQVSVKLIKEVWNHLLKVKKYDFIIHIPISSGLINMYELCSTVAESYEGRVFVVDNKRLSVSLKSTLFSAKKLVKKGLSPREIVEILSSTSNQSSLYFMVDNPRYFKNHCKLNCTQEAINALGYSKPIFMLKDGVIDLYKKCMSRKKAEKLILKAIEKELKTNYKDMVDRNEIELFIAYSGKIEESVAIKQKLLKAHPNIPITYTDQLPISLCAHFGLGVIMIGFSRIYN